ncbi:MAG: DUF3592 domain-containing protein [Pseudomonadales bacterium]|nr:DUF3592 domain-containing protein [Pseudomonadales bacterium]
MAAIIKYTFAIIGVGMLVGAVFSYRATSLFLAQAIKTKGAVVELVLSESRDTRAYQPVVQFASQNGQIIQFVSSTSDSLFNYSRGDIVEVLYDSKNPKNAEINGFFSLWGMVLILGFMGGVFFLIGVGMIFANILRIRKDEYLKNNGVPIETEYQGVESDVSITIQGCHPFRVLTQWKNPSASEVHVFASNSMWFNPESYIKNKTIRVFIENGNPKKYYIDLSFLPKFAK